MQGAAKDARMRKKKKGREEIATRSRPESRVYIAYLRGHNGHQEKFEYFSGYRNNSRRNRDELKEQYLMEKGQEQYDRISWYMTMTFLVKEKKRKGRRKKGG